MKTILVIDDDRSFRSLISDWLSSEGFQSITAANGPKGLAIAQKLQPDLILCDLCMPEMNGFEVLHHLKFSPATTHIPFFFLTSKTELSVEAAGQWGASGVIPKGGELGLLRRAIASV